jgi:tRNA-splicing ligase RtcB
MKNYRYKEYDIIESEPGAWVIPQKNQMNVPGKIYVSEEMLRLLVEEEGGLQQVINVASLPGIQKYSIAMPDIHWGYGFPIGGVAAMDMEEGVISPGGVGYDINCGVRLIRSNLNADRIRSKIGKLIKNLFEEIPTGVGSEGAVGGLNKKEIKDILADGARWAVERGYGTEEDLRFTEENGRLSFADPESVSERAVERGLKQVGTLGSGNHFLELQRVDKIYRDDLAEAYGIFSGQLVMMLHSGSRGLGHQVCDDSIRKLNRTKNKYGINIPDPQLICAPISSPEGREYLGAMSAAANYAWANRQVMMHIAIETIAKVLGASRGELELKLVYDVSHNMAKIEEHEINGLLKKVCVHRKGATRAFPPGSKYIPKEYAAAGQPVIIPGDMGRYSFLAAGAPGAMNKSFGSSCHGAGRLLSRRKALKAGRGRDLFAEIESYGVTIQASGKRTVAEEMPYAYKDVSDVVKIIEQNGISQLVARFRPIGVIKG